MATVPTPVTDKNGRQTTVHKNPDKSANGNVSRVAAVVGTVSKSVATAIKNIDAAKASDIPKDGDRRNFRSDAADVYIERDDIGGGKHVYVVGVVGDPHSAVTELNFAAAKETAKALISPAESSEYDPATADSRATAIELTDLDAEVFDKDFTPELILENAGRIYEYLDEKNGEPDSVARESLFTYAAEKLGVDYEVLYNRWLDEDTSPIALAEPAVLVADESDTRSEALRLTEIPEDVFDKVFTPEAILENAPRIYDFMGENGCGADSVSRESLFAYAADKLGVDYEVLYDKWLSGVTPR